MSWRPKKLISKTFQGGSIEEKENSIEFELRNVAIIIDNLMHNAQNQSEPDDEPAVDLIKGTHEEDGEDDDLGEETSQPVREINLAELTYNPGLPRSERSTAGVPPRRLGYEQGALILDIPLLIRACRRRMQTLPRRTTLEDD